MTQLRYAPSDATPGTHVLIIGVGYYQHLRGGAAPRHHLGLSVLESPPESALQIARWFAGQTPSGAGMYNPKAPLKTMNILIAAREPARFEHNGVSQEIERPTHENVTRAFDSWLAEVEKHPENVGVIYFCGHGIMGSGPEHILLLDDHGSDTKRPFNTGSFDITSTLRALSRTVECPLFIFIDACRTYEHTLGSKIGSLPHPLLGDGASSANINLGTLVFESADENTQAFGQVDGISLFTKALLQALEGFCGTWHAEQEAWQINSSALVHSVPKLLELISKERGYPMQSCSSHPSGKVDISLHQTSQTPKVKVEIELTPESQRAIRGFEICNLSESDEPKIIGGLVSDIWRTEAPKGVYSIHIDSTPPIERKKQYLDPPHYYLPVEILL
jgi:hypothetical protein